MLPQRVPDIPGMEVGAYSRPAQMVGGDYFDFFQFSNGNHGIAIGDAVGHGVSSSLLMASLHASLEALIPMHASPVEVIRRINHLFCHNIRITTLASLFLGSFDPETYQLNYTNAGHNPPLLLRNDAGGPGELVSLDPTGAAIGLVDGTPYFSNSLHLMPGDLLLFYTDGVVETMSPGGELFGTERLEEHMRRLFHLPARELIQTLVSVLKEYSQNGSASDDTTIIACRVTPQ
jgi:sigma-B regulation protein RsbU (phosphoserine phosphatase)